MWSKRSHLLHPLTALTSYQVKLKWNDMEQKALDDIKRFVSQDTLLAYLDFNKLFDIHTDVRDYHIGAVIIQNGKPIALYIRKITRLQTRYTVTEKELLIIFETLK